VKALEAIEGVVELLLLKKLSGREYFIYALLEHINGSSPSELVEKYGISSKRTLKAFFERLVKRAGSPFLAADIVRVSAPIILAEEVWFRESVCLLCGRFIGGRDTPENHIYHSHRKIFRSKVSETVEKVIKQIKTMHPAR
jgi:hypothetical protein